MIAPSIRKILTTTSAAYSLVDDRVYIGNAPQDERRKRVIINTLSRSYPHTHDGDAGYRTADIQLACLAESYQAANEMAEAIRKVVDGYEGSGVTAQVDVLHIEVESADEIERAPFEGRSEPTYGVALQCRCIWEEHGI